MTSIACEISVSTINSSLPEMAVCIIKNIINNNTF